MAMAIRNWALLRCWVPATYARSYLGRALAFLAFQFSGALGALLVEGPDVVIATSPPLVAILPGWLAARRRFWK